MKSVVLEVVLISSFIKKKQGQLLQANEYYGGTTFYVIKIDVIRAEN